MRSFLALPFLLVGQLIVGMGALLVLIGCIIDDDTDYTDPPTTPPSGLPTGSTPRK